MKTNKKQIKTNKRIVYPKLSYQLMGVLFKVHNKLGHTYQEKYYQRAIAIELKRQDIPFKREAEITLSYGNEGIGKHRLDFIIGDKIALEVKCYPFISDEQVKQLFSYLISTNLKLGILVNFRTRKLTYKRLVNPKVILQ